MRGRFLILLLLLVLPLARPAAGAGPMAAVGRLEHEGGGTCSAALIRPDVAVTAAHCARPGDRPVFRPGDGMRGEVYAAARVLRHPLYVATHWKTAWRLRFDIAIVQLERPVPAARAVPLNAGGEARKGETLFVVSWRAGEGDRPRQRACPVIAGGLPGLVALGCPVRGGESGAPVLRQIGEGLELVAVVSSRSKVLNQPIAQASDVALRLPPLLNSLDRMP